MSTPKTAAAALQVGVATLKLAGIASAAGDARALLAHAMDISAERLTLHLPDELPAQARIDFDAHIAARARHQPVAQIIGERLFWGRVFAVTRDTLDPRPETEILVAEALRLPFNNILDLGTGTGCILLSCLADMPTAHGVGSDVSDAALLVAARNAQKHGLTARATFKRSDWFSAISSQFDLIVSNPPYISEGEMANLSPDVRLWEPHLALSPGGDGLESYRAIAAGAAARLITGGRILLEIGPTQGPHVSALLAKSGFSHITVLPDFDGRARVVCAQYHH